MANKDYRCTGQFFLGGLSRLCSKNFSTAPQKTAMLICKITLPDSPHPVIISKPPISGTLSRQTEWIPFFFRLINTKIFFNIIVYSCCAFAVADAWSESCVLAATVPDVVGYIPNRLRPPHPAGERRPRCGTERRPWIISVLPGQHINITLLDFTAFHGRQLPRTNRKACHFHGFHGAFLIRNWSRYSGWSWWRGCWGLSPNDKFSPALPCVLHFQPHGVRLSPPPRPRFWPEV